MKDDKDSPSDIMPMLKLSRVSRKPRKRIAETTGAQKSKGKKRQRRKKTDIPIPSFSPIHKLDELDTSILESPVKTKPEPEEQLVVLLNDDDDDDDDLLDAPPTFAPTQPSKSQSIDKKPSISEKKKILNVGDREGQESCNNTDTLPDEAKQTIDTILNELDHTTLNLRDAVNMVLAKNGYEDGDEQMRKLIRAHIRSILNPDSAVDETSPNSVEIQQDPIRDAKQPVKKKKGAKKPKVKPDEDDLIVSIDGLFVQANADITTEKDFVEALEGQYGNKLHKTSRTFARTRLKALIQGTVEPTVSFSPPQGTAAVLKDAPNLEEQRDEPGKECDDGSDDVYAFEDEDVTPANASIQVATNEQEVDPKKPMEEQVVASQEKTLQQTKPKRRRRPPKKTSNGDHVEITGIDVSESVAGGVKQQKPAEKPRAKKKAAPPKKPRAPQAKKGTCALCTTCTCTIGKETNVVDASAVMSRTDAEIERSLIRRTQKLERIVDKYETLLDQVNRELKKHRRNAWKKQEAQLNDGRRLAFGESRFLPDADAWDEQAQAVDCVALPSPIVEEARETLFGNGSRWSCYVICIFTYLTQTLLLFCISDCQITLTQIFGGVSKEKGENTDQDILDNPALEEDAEKEEKPHSQLVTDEDKEDAADNASAIDMEYDYEPEPDPVDHIHRVSWRKGAIIESQTPFCQGSGAWSTLTTNKDGRNPQCSGSTSSPVRELGNVSLATSASKYDCAWDALFSADVSDDSNDDDSRIDQLLDLFENEISEESASPGTSTSASTHREGFTQESQFEAAVLSQRGENIAVSIEDAIASDPTQLESIEGACPKWRDNIRFALAHKGETEIGQALERVQRSMQALQATKQKVSTLWSRQEVVLKLFEMSLSASLSRLERPEAVSLQGDFAKETAKVRKKEVTSSIQGKALDRLSPLIECEELPSQSSQ